MKISVLVFKSLCTAWSCLVLVTSCSKPSATEPPVDPPPPGNPVNSIKADTIASHLLFLKADKKQGIAPKGPAGSSLKISFKDTFYLSDKIKKPIKFLHMDTTKNVAGVYVQVHYSPGGSNTTFYYDVPEVQDMAYSDTVSVILMGINPTGLIDIDDLPPAGPSSISCTVTLTPYDKNKQPIAEATRPLEISKNDINTKGNSGAQQGLELPVGDFWLWELSLIEDPSGNGDLAFYNDPKKVWGGGGQFITGCCIDGVSSYNQVLNCHLDPTKARRKIFPTYFQHMESAIKYSNDGTYSQFSRQINVNPAPDETNFCSAAPGVVYGSAKSVTEEGTWKITKPPVPYYGDSLLLSLTQTSSTGFGLVSPYGYIHELNSTWMTLIIPNNEQPKYFMTSFYTRIGRDINGWYNFL